MQWESARKVDASNYANIRRVFQLNSIKSVKRERVVISVCSESGETKTVAWMKMAFNGGCDTDGPHNKRLCTGQNSINVNDNNNNTNGSGLCSNGTSGGDVDMSKGLGLLRVKSFSHHKVYTTKIIRLKLKANENLTEISHPDMSLSPISISAPFLLTSWHIFDLDMQRFWVKLNLIADAFMTALSATTFHLSGDSCSIYRV